MRKIILLACSLWLIGCVHQPNGGPLLTYEQIQDRKGKALRQGAPWDEVTRAWGQPDERYVFGGPVNGETYQYGSCAASRSVTSGVVFITIVEGQVYSWRTTRC